MKIFVTAKLLLISGEKFAESCGEVARLPKTHQQSVLKDSRNTPLVVNTFRATGLTPQIEVS